LDYCLRRNDVSGYGSALPAPARRFAETSRRDETVYITRACRQTRLPQADTFRAYANWFGIGPARFRAPSCLMHKNYRLRDAASQLCEPQCSNSSVSAENSLTSYRQEISSQTLNSPGLNSTVLPTLIAWLTFRMVTVVSYAFSGGQFSVARPRTASKKFCRWGLW
jgi:hypothetical protein